MKYLIALALCVVVAAATTYERPPIATIEELEVSSNPRIISGKPAAPGQFKHQVANRFKVSGGTAFCGGSLISDRWVLTAGHCAKDATHFTLYLGSVNQSQPVEQGRVVVETAEKYVHPSYNPFTLANDIALVRLQKPVNFTDRIQPISLASHNTPANKTLTVSGWGKTSDASNSVSPVLNYVELDAISNPDCAKVYGSLTVTNGTICCKGRPEHSTCNGDSGGPLIEKVNNTWVQVGVVSFVHRAGCASGNPSGYARVQYYLDWITQITGGAFISA
ncbi:hypothetical protein ILUMI_24819 [Ignelater luminosus]|uniref:Peptidase S1 domain-containing protein n=1 Tax=Ignelater luminosus TaxID=2038154 RepID=A0A8K0C9K5_IGNLU|nr:hypothetical protein ILUMI_24819 [Ignelater luminosus]